MISGVIPQVRFASLTKLAEEDLGVGRAKAGPESPGLLCLPLVSRRRRDTQENEEKGIVDITLERRLHTTENWKQQD